ncbi:MAG: glycosyltransferase family 4 protein [Paraglaciecola sp.]|uniref:glycosyltransferase family 4 protein n=1 Tax=Paraglaciecola sp. TaxID=1920173 RepID=UPI003296C295
MKKTLLLSEIFPPLKGGSGRWFWEVYSRLDTKRVVIAAGDNDSAAEFDDNNRLNCHRLPLSSWSWGLKSLTGLAFYWRVFKAVLKLIKQENIESIHCGRCLPEGFIGFLINKYKGIPYICYIHGEDVETAATSRELSWIVRKALSNADKLICNSQNTANIVLNQWGTEPGKTFIVNPGVDTHVFVPAQASLSTRKQLGWGSRKIILTVGRLQERKGHDMLIQALPEIIKVQPDVLYAIIGDGEKKGDLQQLVENLHLQEHVIFMSELTDQQMIQCYQQCDVFVLPNRSVGRDIEGFGMVLVEAQSCEKPVIAGDSGGTAETMLLNETGFIVDCTSPTHLPEKINLILKDPELAKKMGQKGREHVIETLDWENLTQQAVRLFP